MTRDPRLAPVRAYLGRRPDDPALSRLREQLEAPQALFSRKNMTGHITASGLVLTPDQGAMLLVGHKGLGRWLQPGGHVDDDDAEIWHAAQREIAEETGVTEITLHPWHAGHGSEPVDIDTHPIPARPAKAEGAHFHHDCLFIFVALKIAMRLQEDEVSAASWCRIDDPRVPERLRSVYSHLRPGRPGRRKCSG
jgi:8-oxo-dGTP pyrophosphatase MutT (NUDIX family)